MPPNVLSSSVVTVPVLDALLDSRTSPPTPAKRVQLLSTKLAILTNRPSQPVRGQPFDVEVQVLRCRLDLAGAYLALASEGESESAGVSRGSSVGSDVGVAVSRGSSANGGVSFSKRGSSSSSSRVVVGDTGQQLKLAESELNLVERECKGIIKRYTRLVKQERDKEAGAGAGREGEGQAEVGQREGGHSISDGTKSSTTSSPTRPSGDVVSALGKMSISNRISSSTPDSSSASATSTSSPSTSSRAQTGDTSTSTSTSDPSSTPDATTPTTSPPLTASTPLTPRSAESRRQKRLQMIIDIRIEGLRVSVVLEDRMGRADRKARLEGMIRKLELDAG